MRLDKGSLAACHAAAKENMRYALNNIQITPEEVVATDGRMIVRIKHPEQVNGEAIKDAVLVDAKLASKIFRDTPKGGAIDITKNGNGLRFDVKKRQKTEIDPVYSDIESRILPLREGKYPPVDEVMPKGEPIAEIAFDLGYLATLEKIVRALTWSGTKPTIKIEIFGKNKAARLTAIGCDDRFAAVLMPVMLD